MQHSAVLFDLDGTLLDTIEDIADSMNQVLSRFGFPGHDLEAYKHFVGDGVESLIRRVLPAHQVKEDLITQCLAAMREEYGRRWNHKTRPYPGIPELLDALYQKEIPLAILSNKVHEFSQMAAANLLQKWPFKIVLGSRPAVPNKPDPAGALEIAVFLGLAPNKIVYLGDTGIDMKTAVRADMFPLGALWGFRTAQELMANGAKALIQEPLDLLDYL